MAAFTPFVKDYISYVYFRVKGYPTPEITWLKEGLSIENNPDYKTSFENGVCSLTIEEVFVEDSATFVCRAVNEAGTTDSIATLSVTGKE